MKIYVDCKGDLNCNEINNLRLYSRAFVSDIKLNGSKALFRGKE